MIGALFTTYPCLHNLHIPFSLLEAVSRGEIGQMSIRRQAWARKSRAIVIIFILQYILEI